MDTELPPRPSLSRPEVLFHWMRDPFATMRRMRAECGETFTLRLGMMPTMVVLSNPEHVREVFAAHGDDMHAGQVARILGPFLGTQSLLLLDGPPHRRMRKLLMPPFHGERMEVYGQQMVDITHESVDRWPLGEALAIHEPMQAITLEVILRTVFGLDDATARDALGGLLSKLIQIASWPPLLLPQLQRDLGPWSPWGRFVRLGEVADKKLIALIEKRREEGTEGRTDILSMLVDARDEAGEGLSDQDIRDQLVTLLVAGHETTATALSWTIKCLLDNPDVFAKLQSELEAARADGLTPAAIAKLEYLDAVVREALRLQPVIPLVGRVLQKPMTIGPWSLPAGVAVAPSVYLAHQREETFASPERFDPERFLGKKKPAPTEWFPFGGGGRRCIGMAFALFEMKMVLATVLVRTRLAKAPGPPVRAIRRSVTMAPSRGMPVIVRSRMLRARAG